MGAGFRGEGGKNKGQRRVQKLGCFGRDILETEIQGVVAERRG